MDQTHSYNGSLTAEQFLFYEIRIASKFHVLSCSECASMYTSMIDLRDASQTAIRDQRVETSQISAKSQRDLIEQQMSEDSRADDNCSARSTEQVEEKNRDISY